MSHSSPAVCISFYRLFFVLLIVSLQLAIATVLSSGENAAEFVKENIADNDVMVFAKSYCPFCRKTRVLLETLQEEVDGWSLEILDFDLMEGDDGPTIQGALLELTGQRTVPNIFICGKHIGGNSDIQALHEEEKLVALLEECAAKSSLHDEV